MVSCFIGKIIPATKAPFDFLNPFLCRLGPVVIQTHDTMVVGVRNRVPPDGFASRIDKPVHVVRVMWVCSKLHVFQPTSHKALGIAVLRTITLYPCIQRHRLREANRQWSVIIASQSVVRHHTPVNHQHISLVVSLHHRGDLLAPVPTQILIHIQESYPGIFVAVLLVAIFVHNALRILGVGYVRNLHQSAFDVRLQNILHRLFVTPSIVVNKDLRHTDFLVVFNPLRAVSVFQPTDGTYRHPFLTSHLWSSFPQFLVLIQPPTLCLDVVILPTPTPVVNLRKCLMSMCKPFNLGRWVRISSNRLAPVSYQLVRSFGSAFNAQHRLGSK